MRKPDRGRDVGAGRQDVSTTLSSRSEPAPGERDHWSQAQCLSDHRARVRVVRAGIDLGEQARENLGVAEHEIERPREPGRSRLVAGKQKRDQLIADLGVSHRRAILEPSGDEHGEDVVARVGPALGDLDVEQRVDRLALRLQPLQRVRCTEPAR